MLNRAELAVLTLLALLTAAFAVSGCGALGGMLSGERLRRAEQSPQWHNTHFANPQASWTNISDALLDRVFEPSTPATRPDAPVPTVASSFATPSASGLRVTWFGHSSALLEIDGVNVLVDPLAGTRVSPVAWAGPKPWYAPPVAFSELPPIDVVVISHDHYDHLDHAAITALQTSHAVFVTPLGVGAHLARWGITVERIVELDWWQSTTIGALTLTATPARHASGRMSSKSNRTLWAGWAMAGPRYRAWYSGDTGYHDELTSIGERLGPFDVTLIEAGQYDAHWPDAHLGPELAVEAHRDVRGRVMIPVHWALLELANHTWTEPAERVLRAAECRGIEVLVPRPGESIEPTEHPDTPRWWPLLPWRTARQNPIVATRDGDAAQRIAIPQCTTQE